MQAEKEKSEAFIYIREKINQLLDVMGTYPLKPEELDDKTLIELDPIGIIAASFKQILKHHEETIAELELAKNEIRTVFDSINASILVIDQDKCIKDFNQNAKNNFFANKSSNDIYDTPINNSCNFDNGFINELFTSPDKPYNLVYNSRNFTVTLNFIGQPDSKQFLAIINFYDITEQKKIELELSQHRNNLEELVYQRTEAYKNALEDAKSANRAKSEFLSSMSHELRTPLNAILGFGQILELELKTNPTLESHIREILHAGYHLLNLVNDVLDLAKIEEGKLDVHMEETSVSKTLKECLSLIQASANERQIKIIENISNNNFQVQADPIRFKQVLLNILSNAVKYNREQGHIEIEGEIVGNQFLRISITDNGEGFNEEEAENLFIPFERITTEKNIEGTGIGLVITRYLTGLMDGSLEYKSTPGEGSTFSVIFQLA
jgi:signal transduction histidine kinase